MECIYRYSYRRLREYKNRRATNCIIHITKDNVTEVMRVDYFKTKKGYRCNFYIADNGKTYQASSAPFYRPQDAFRDAVWKSGIAIDFSFYGNVDVSDAFTEYELRDYFENKYPDHKFLRDNFQVDYCEVI